MRLAIDAMGGDFAPHEVVLGAVAARDLLPGDEIILVGDEAALRGELAAAKASEDRLTIVHASQQVGMAESPVEAIRKKPDSSMRRAMELMAKGQADAVISAGNTGAFVAAAHMVVKRLPGIRRPGIAVVFPTFRGPVVLMDVGANIDCRAGHLLQYGLMADLYARKIVGIEKPRVGLLSVGEEDEKGNDLIRQTHELLEKAPLHFCGNAEGRDIFNGRFDVVVCDGFVGNIVLKCVEGLAESVFHTMHQSFKGAEPAVLSKVAPVLTELQRRLDAEEYGGAPLMGVEGIVIICHGNSRARAIANACKAAETYARKQVNRMVVEAVAQTGGTDA